MRSIAIMALFLLSTGFMHAQEQYMELLRSDLKTQRKVIITEVMEFTDAEAETFWKMYRDYDYKRTEYGDRYISMIKQYAEHYDNLTNEIADEIMTGMFKLDEDETDLKRSFYKELREAFGATTAARFIQLENMMDRLIDLQVTSQLPLVEKINP